jgi:hypothetical protein
MFTSFTCNPPNYPAERHDSPTDNCNWPPPGSSMIAKLSDEMILSIFDFYQQSFRNQPTSEMDWNNKDGWFKLAHVCQNWHCIVLPSLSRLWLQLYFTDKTPTMAAVLTSLPPLPIIINYLHHDAFGTVSAQNCFTSVLRYPECVCRIALAVTHESSSTISKALDTHFPTLESLEVDNISSWTPYFSPTFMTSTKSLRQLKISAKLAPLVPLLLAITALIDLTLSINLVICPWQGVSLLALLQCHRRCSESLDYSDCCIKSSMIEMRMIECCLRGQVTMSDGRGLSPRQEVEDEKAMNC